MILAMWQKPITTTKFSPMIPFMVKVQNGKTSDEERAEAVVRKADAIYDLKDRLIQNLKKMINIRYLQN